MFKAKKLELSLFIFFFLILLIGIIVKLKAGIEYEFFSIIKPGTVIQYSGFISFALLLNLCKNYLSKLNKNYLKLFIIFGFFCIMGSLFEVFWSFGYWFANYELQVLSGLPQDSQTLDYTIYIPSKEL